jgi:hypothetical protein
MKKKIPTHAAGLGQEKWFWLSIIAQVVVACERRKQWCAPVREECNKYDLTTTQCFLNDPS